jgi:uncharacterized protein YcfL
MRHVSMLATILVLSLSLCGCKSDTAPSPGMGDYYPAPMNDPQISIVSPDLRKHLGFQPAIIEHDGQRPMSVEIPMRNLTYQAYQLEYRMIFLNESGREQTPIMGWQHLPLDPKQVARLKGSAMGTDAVSYRVEVRWSR